MQRCAVSKQRMPYSRNCSGVAFSSPCGKGCAESCGASRQSDSTSFAELTLGDNFFLVILLSTFTDEVVTGSIFTPYFFCVFCGTLRRRRK